MEEVKSIVKPKNDFEYKNLSKIMFFGPSGKSGFWWKDRNSTFEKSFSNTGVVSEPFLEKFNLVVVEKEKFRNLDEKMKLLAFWRVKNTKQRSYIIT